MLVTFCQIADTLLKYNIIKEGCFSTKLVKQPSF